MKDDLAKLRLEIWLPIAVSLVALIVSIRSCDQSQDVEAEQSAVRVHVGATLMPYRRGLGLPITISYANESLRSIIVQRVELWRRHQRLTAATNYAAVANLASDDRRIGQLVPLPLTMGTREGGVIRVVFTDSGPEGESLDDCFGVGAGDALDQILSRRNSRSWCLAWRHGLGLWQSGGPAHPDVRLKLRVVPGGTLDFPLSADEPARAPSEDWYAGIKSPDGTKLVLVMWLTTREPPPPGTFRMDLYRVRDFAFHRSFERPFSGVARTRFTLPPLRTGRYTYLIRVNGLTIASGCFRVPPTNYGHGHCISSSPY